ncbi:MAG: NUDIX hydrolase, partial [Cellulosilyticaceae bacterium]
MNNKSEVNFLKNYNVEDYKRPSVATDIVALSVFTKEEANYRKLPEQNLHVLLIKRGEYPYKDWWALPGGFVKPEETVDETARRELEEETGVRDVYMEQLYTFSEVDRDPRTRVISASYMALMNKGQELHPSTDAQLAKWFKIDHRLLDTKIYEIEDGKKKEVCYLLKLEADDEILEAKLCFTKLLKGDSLEVQYEVIETNGIAFDHSKIIALAMERLKGKIEYTDVAFYLAPTYFTLTGLQKIYELVLGK